MITAFATGGYSGNRDRQPNKRSSAWAQRCLLMTTISCAFMICRSMLGAIL